MPGLIVVKDNEQLQQEADEQREDLLALEDEQVVSALVASVHGAWERNKRAKLKIDDELLECMRQAAGEYSPDEKALIESQGSNPIYMMLTATKISAAVSWIQDVILPVGALPVGLDPTEMPDLPPEVMAELIRNVMLQVQQEVAAQRQQMGGEQAELPPGYIKQRIEEIKTDVLQRVKQQARERADKMTRKLVDQMEEGGFREAMEDFLNDFAKFPTAILKGPIYRKQHKIEWGPMWQPRQTEHLSVTFERINPFDVYPSPDATSVNEGDFIERSRMTRSQLYELIGRDGYDDDAIKRVLENHTGGWLVDWLWTDSERYELENKGDWWRTDTSLVDALVYWGYVDGCDLIDWGMSGDIDPVKPYHVNAIVIGNECIYCARVDDPLQRRPYQAASMHGVPGSFWGEALPKRMRHTQKMCNSLARSLVDNLALSSGPQAAVNVDALADGEDVTNIYPRKVWQLSYNPDSAGQARPVTFFQPESNAPELMGLYDKFEVKADDETGIPRYVYGNEKVSGAASTASGLSMLFDSASKGIRRAISHIDAGVMRPLFEKMWLDEMRYGEDVSLKGDANVVTRGAAALLIADQAQQRRLTFLNMTNNPVDMQIIRETGRAEVLREFAKSLDMDADNVVPTREEIEQRVKQQQQQQDPKQQEAMAKLQLEQAKLQEKAKQDQAELAQKEQEDERQYTLDRDRLKLDSARYLSDEELKAFQRRMELSDRMERMYA